MLKAHSLCRVAERLPSEHSDDRVTYEGPSDAETSDCAAFLGQYAIQPILCALLCVRVVSSHQVDPMVLGPSGRVALVPAHELACPVICWPTIVLFLVSMLLLLVPAYMCWTSPTLLAFPTSTLAIYMLFTCMHDAAHSSVSTRHKWINGVMGRAASIFFQAPFPAFRFIHLQHHKYTNDPEKDPDAWSACAEGTPWIHKLLLWLTQSWFYYTYYLHYGLCVRSPVEATEVVATVSAYLVVLMWLGCNGMMYATMVFFVGPRICAETFLAYSFDYVVHHPHKVTRKDNIYATTSCVTGLFDAAEDVDLTLPLLCQNLHAIHHLYPFIPFTRYGVIWRNHRKELTEVGVPSVAWFGKGRAKCQHPGASSDTPSAQ